jgi:predicted lysophospholipase L1 biosynthesis ABC-type transport system permease subunit
MFGSAAAAVGQSLAVPGRHGDQTWRVIGVTSDIAGPDVREGPQPSAFAPLGRDTRIGTIVLRAPIRRAEITAAVRQAARHADPTLPVDDVTSIADRVDEQLAQERLMAELGGVIAAIAAALALAGVYAVMAFVVSERTREFGIRRALGASSGAVAVGVLRRVVATGAVGVAIGAGIAVAAGRLLRGWLYGVSPSDPLTMIAAAVVLMTVAIVAAAIPARRATRVDPVVALRAE